MAKFKFGDKEETVVTREEIPLEKAQETLEDEIVAVLGYGVQGPAQAANMKDNGINVIIGQRKDSSSWEQAIEDGWIEGENLFTIEEAAQKGTVVMFLLSDAGQIAVWPRIKKHLTKDKALYFSHGFGIVYKEQTGIVPPKDIDVILVAPKGAGKSVRENFLNGSGINASFAVHQDASGRAEERVKALGIAIGAGYLFPTTFENEVWSDLTGERGVLLGAIVGLMEAQYNVFRKMGHSPSEAFNETVEELTQSLIPMMAEKGADWMIANCSTTAQRGALDWMDKFRDINQPLIEKLYKKVKKGEETKRVIEANSDPDYRKKLADELEELRNREIWKTGQTVRKLRPENRNKEDKPKEDSED
jgi:ketol-acid reductoisomerase